MMKSEIFGVHTVPVYKDYSGDILMRAFTCSISSTRFRSVRIEAAAMS